MRRVSYFYFAVSLYWYQVCLTSQNALDINSITSDNQIQAVIYIGRSAVGTQVGVCSAID